MEGKSLWVGGRAVGVSRITCKLQHVINSQRDISAILVSVYAQQKEMLYIKKYPKFGAPVTKAKFLHLFLHLQVMMKLKT